MRRFHDSLDAGSGLVPQEDAMRLDPCAFSNEPSNETLGRRKREQDAVRNRRRNQDGVGRTGRRRGTPVRVPAPAGVRAQAHAATQANTRPRQTWLGRTGVFNQSAEKSGRAPKSLDPPVRNVAVGWQQSQAGISFTGPSSLYPLSGAWL